MNLSNRDKLLLSILPAIVVLTAYGWSISGKHRQLAELTKQRDAARQQAPQPESLRNKEMQLVSLNSEISRQEKELQTIKQHWDEVAAKCGSPELRNERIKKLTTLLMQHRLTVLDDAEAEANKMGKLPLPIDQLAQQLAQTNKNLKPQLRQLHLRGGFVDLHHALQELSQGEVLAIPLNLTMKAGSDGGSNRDWTLLVWI